MPFKPPITIQQLHDIQERNRDNPDVIALLWEIRRLHQIAVTAHAYASSDSRFDQTRNMMADKLLNLTKHDPAVVQHQEWVAGLLKRPD